jgi:hypothetical protein
MTLSPTTHRVRDTGLIIQLFSFEPVHVPEGWCVFLGFCGLDSLGHTLIHPELCRLHSEAFLSGNLYFALVPGGLCPLVKVEWAKGSLPECSARLELLDSQIRQYAGTGGGELKELFALENN